MVKVKCPVLYRSSSSRLVSGLGDPTREPPSQLHHLSPPRRERGRRRPRRGSARPRRRREPGLRSISSLSPSLRYALSLSTKPLRSGSWICEGISRDLILFLRWVHSGLSVDLAVWEVYLRNWTSSVVQRTVDLDGWSDFNFQFASSVVGTHMHGLLIRRFRFACFCYFRV